jgi:hypothetical protein
MYGRLYGMGSDGKPGRLLCDFGSFGTNPMSTGSTSVPRTATASTGVYLPPGEYWANLFVTLASETTHPAMGAVTTGFNGSIFQTIGTTGYTNVTRLATGAVSTAPDPANVTGWALGAGTEVPAIGFAPS